MPIDDVLNRKLKHVETMPSAEWRVWEHKTLNMHRAVLEWTPGGMPRSYAEITAGIRSEVARRFNVSWWRGMGFGVVIYLNAPPEGIAACIDDIDGRENSRGTWQWSIIVFRQNRVAVGVHMWMSGYLSTIYGQTLSRFESEGYRIATCKKDKDRLMQFLTLVHPFPEHVDLRRNTEPNAPPNDGPATPLGNSDDSGEGRHR
jgi:hypothetical protein